MKALYVECFKEPEVIDIENTLNDLQMAVCGNVEEVFLSNTACLLCNENGKLIDARPNRVCGEDYIVGDFIICGIACDDFCSLSDADIEKYKKEFAKPSFYFLRVADRRFVEVQACMSGYDFLEYDLLQCTDESKFIFFGYEFAKEHGLCPKVYKKVYHDIVPIENPQLVCERLYQAHNTRIRDRKGHSMSVSDILVLHFKDGDRYFYTDTVGFEEIYDFKWEEK